MLDEIFGQSFSDPLTVTDTLLTIGVSLVLGFVISFVYMGTHKKEGYSSGFAITLIMLPCIIGIIILLVGNNIARAFSLAGAFSLIRYRSAPGEPKDIAYVFFTLAVGLACGMGYLAYAALFALILGLVMVALHFLHFGWSPAEMKLKITLPEDADYQSLFKDIFEQDLKSYRFSKVKTTNFGSLYEVCYIVRLKPETNNKAFLDKLRCRNNNLNISLSASVDSDAV